MPYQPRISTAYTCRWYSPRNGRRPMFIVAHATVGADSRAYLARGGELPDGSDRKVSIHVLIAKDGTLYRMLPDDRAANHAGFGTYQIGGTTYDPDADDGTNVNTVSLGFELENLQNGKDPYPDEQLKAMAWQINDWRRQYGPLPLVRHADIDPTRRSDTLGLSVAMMEAQCRALFPTADDEWAAWGVPIPLAQRGWGIPKRWLAELRAGRGLGAAASGEIPAPGMVFQVFERGAIWYHKDGGATDVYRFPW